MAKPKIAFFDIETSPNILTMFDIKNKNPIHFQNIQQERYIICASFKWLGSDKIYSYKVNPKKPTDDREILKQMQKMFSQADAVVAHYGDGFDVLFINSRLAFHRLKPLAPAVQIDTYKMAKQKFLFNSNKLDYLGQYLGFGRKKSIGYSSWLGCLKGDKKEIDFMVSYNRQDVLLLEKIYTCLAAYCKPKVNHAVSEGQCKHCGEFRLTKQGIRITATKSKQRYQCQECGAWQLESK